MGSKIATKLLSEMTEEQKKKVDKYADKLVLSNVSNWVSVNDAIPYNNESVLCYNGKRMIQNSWMVHTDQDDKWFRKTFTHWMPLPKPPCC